MAGCCKKVTIVLAILAAYLGYKFHNFLYYVPPLQDLPRDQWWGPGSPPAKLDTSIRPFKVEFTEAMITDLKSRIDRGNQFTDPLEDVGFQYGFNNNYLKEIIQFWRTKYNFAEREAFLNQYPQFKTNIQGLDIHYIHIKPKVPKNIRTLPLLLMHGWPGSVREFYEMIPMLTTPRKENNFVFELIVPSLPGYGFSQPAAKRGLSSNYMAVIMRNLMERLGHDKFYAQGGDWGSNIATTMALLYPDAMLGFHLNAAMSLGPVSMFKLFLGSLYPPSIVDKEHESIVFPLSHYLTEFIFEEAGYMHIQSTKPDTIGVALRDSPVGLAAYIIEKFSTWTNRGYRSLPDGGLTKKFSVTNMLDNIMIYWVTGTITTSMRLYSESLNFNSFKLGFEVIPVEVPIAIAVFKNDMFYPVDCTLKDRYLNIVQKTELPDGGHFAAFEEPAMFADDLLASIPKFEKFHREKNAKPEL